jgi:hypothetical protein
MTPLDEIFLAETMTATAERFAAQDEDNHFLKVYERGGDVIRPVGDSFTWDEVVFSRGMAAVTGPNSPTKAARQVGKIERAAKVLAIKEHVDLDVRFLLMARGDGQLMPNPEQELNKNIKNLTMRLRRTLNFLAAQSFLATGGAVNLGAFPNTDLPNPTTITYPIQSINAAAAWSAIGTKIRSSEANALKRVGYRTSGLKPAYAIASDVVEGYITQNTELTNTVDGGGVQTLAQRRLETSYLEGGALLRMGGIDWEFARDCYAASDDTPETVTDVITDTDLVAVLPEPSRWGECFAKVEGVSIVPTGPVSQLAAGNALSMISQARGVVLYVTLEKNPMRFRLHAEWVGHLVHKVQKAAIRFNTTP